MKAIKKILVTLIIVYCLIQVVQEEAPKEIMRPIYGIIGWIQDQIEKIESILFILIIFLGLMIFASILRKRKNIK